MKEKITLILPGCGVNHLWQLGCIQALYDLGLDKKIDSVYTCSGGAWSGIFLGLGIRAIDEWVAEAPEFFEKFQRRNRFNIIRKLAFSLRRDTRYVLSKYKFFEKFEPNFDLYIKVLKVFPNYGTRVVNTRNFAPKNIHRLAIATSTIPLITGFFCRVGMGFYVDGGLSRKAHKRNIHSEHLKNTIIVLNVYDDKYEFSDVNIIPGEKLPHSLRVVTPFPITKEEMEASVKKGYKDIMRFRRRLLRRFKN